jgi:hypothetical protein
VEEIMSRTNDAATPMLEEPGGTPPEGPSPAHIVLTIVVPAVVALAGGAGVVAAAVTWGAAETAVGLAAAYGVFLGVSGRAGELVGEVRAAVRMIAVAAARVRPTGNRGERPIE